MHFGKDFFGDTWTPIICRTYNDRIEGTDKDLHVFPIELPCFIGYLLFSNFDAILRRFDKDFAPIVSFVFSYIKT